jgi:hypothetical protein
MYACAALKPLPPPTDVRRVPPPNVLDDVEPNPRGITRAEVEAAIADCCARSPEGELCKKLTKGERR